MWWGFSQALDLVDELEESKPAPDGGDNKTTCNVLLAGQYDGRHMLKTIAQKYRHKEDVAINFYVYEPLLENIARELLLTTLALEPPERIGITEKTLFFLELYGNTLLRPGTSKYLIKVSKRLLNVITNIDYGQKILPSVFLNNLKYKERDQLEVVFKYWASCDNSFNILKAWDERVRKHLGVRYDSRLGAYDWDYHMRYRCFGADILQSQEYKKFREKGIAFHFEDTDPCIPNATLASAIFSAGSKILSYGYLGDIVTGPYVTFGLDCDDKDMLKKVNGQFYKRATDICERNLTRMFYELQHQSPFVAPSEENNLIGLFVDTSDRLKVQEESFNDECKQIKIKDACEEYKSLGTNNCTITFLPTSALKDFVNKTEFDNFFDLAFVTQTLVLKNIKPELCKIFKNNCKVIVDTPKFVLNFRKEDLEKFKTDLVNLMKDCNCKLIGSYNHETDEIARFQYEK